MSSSSRGYAFAVGAVAASSGLSYLMYPRFELTNLVMVYLLGTLAVASQGLRGPAALSALLSVLAFDFLFVPPRFTLSVSDVQYVWTFAVMFTAAMVISHLTIRLREEADAARESERRSAWLMEKAKKAEIDAESERLRSSLLSSVSHDFRTPLAAIVGSAEALLEKEEFRRKPADRQLLENIEAEADRLSRLVQNLLETTRLESGKVDLKKEPCLLEEIVEAALSRLERTLAGRSVAAQIPEDLPLISADPLLMEQVFINLLENAARHTPAGRAIEIRAQAAGDAVEAAVLDAGEGLPADALPQIFEKFYHGAGSSGAGLGLAICRAIILAHGGRIWAENRPEGGAAFRFSLPMTSSSADSGGGSPASGRRG